MYRLCCVVTLDRFAQTPRLRERERERERESALAAGWASRAFGRSFMGRGVVVFGVLNPGH
jgi:hypothetical protein